VVATILATSSSISPAERAPEITVSRIAATLEVWGGQQSFYPTQILEELEEKTGHRIVLASADGKTIVGDSQNQIVADTPPSVSADAVIDPLRPRFSLTADAFPLSFQPSGDMNNPADISLLWLDPPLDEPAVTTTLGWVALIGIVAGIAIAALALSTAVLRPVHSAVYTARSLASGQRAEPRGRSAIFEFNQLNQALDHLDTMLAEAAERRRALTDDLAHEIRSPLTSALGRLRGVNEGYFEADEQFIDGVIADLELLDRLVGDLRTTTQAEQHSLELNLQTVNLEEAVLQAIDAEVPGRTVNLKVPSISIQADQIRLQQILRNLLSNADRYSPADGSIDIEAHKVEGFAELTVRDHGTGVAPGDEERIFERFFRDDDARSKSIQSTGLGLTIARALARGHGGDLTTANHPDGGAIFTLRLPVSN
jgi:signal transduction histidine kinase